jgi:hypothetical protein
MFLTRRHFPRRLLRHLPNGRRREPRVLGVCREYGGSVFLPSSTLSAQAFGGTRGLEVLNPDSFP